MGHENHRKGCKTHRCDRRADRAWARRHCQDEPILRFFRQHLTPAQAAGIVGNTMQESGNNPYASGGGLVQGGGGRTCCGTLQEQLRSIWNELTGPERSTLAALRRAVSPEEAARIFSTRFERPGIPNLPARERYAREAFDHRCRR